MTEAVTPDGYVDPKTVDPDTLPLALRCETCGAPIAVIITWLEKGETSIFCYPCFLATAANVIAGMAALEEGEGSESDAALVAASEAAGFVDA